MSLHFFSQAEKNAFLRTSGIAACEIVANGLACLQVVEGNTPWQNNAFVSRVTQSAGDVVQW